MPPLQVGARMGAYRTLLTHFSQRYPKLPAGLDAAAAQWRRRPIVGFDGMVVPLALLPQLPALTPLVAAAFGEDGDGGVEGEAEGEGGEEAMLEGGGCCG
jgi:ribonuclease Z